jgi:murein L,D-transpeptidase YafK
LKEGDLQAPEGFYEVGIKQLNPMSRFHLSFNIGYPNAYDQHHGRTGSLIMVHGSNVSIGCFAMTDPVIEEIYLLVEAALKAGQVAVPVHVFPFRMTAERIAQAEAEGAAWLSFWRDELAPPYAAFEKKGVPPGVKSVEGRYEVAKEP